MTPLLKGMVVSNEPGYYEDHAFGIRIEVCNHLFRELVYSAQIVLLLEALPALKYKIGLSC